jgi:hypothetical protein
VDLHDVAQGARVVWAGGERAELAAVVAVDGVIRVHPEQHVATGVLEGFVAGRGEIVAPREAVDPGAELAAICGVSSLEPVSTRIA